MEELSIAEYNGHKIAVSLHEADSKKIVVFCHGYRGSNVGPGRFFVRAARKLAKQGVSSLRFDQYGSGNSGGEFYDSSFIDWVENAQSIADKYLKDGYQVALFGQSMGAATSILVGVNTPAVTSVVAWVPDPNIGEFQPGKEGFLEEGGYRVRNRYWQEAHDALVADKLKKLTVPAYVVQCTADEYVDAANRKAIADAAQPNHEIDTFEGYSHSSWGYDESEEIIDKSVSFILDSFK